METRDIFENLSPLDHRYWIANRELFDTLSSILSEKAQLRWCARVEAALLVTHLELRGRSDPELFASIEAAAESVDPAEVYEEEEKTRHNIRALVNVLQRKVPADVASLVHLGATSVDILDTAKSLSIRDATRRVVLPLLARVEVELCRLAMDESETAQVGRTHGQHAVPLTFGFALAEYASRLGKCVLRARELAGDLRGKLAGAVGSYNALSMSYPDPEAVEERFLARLGLEASEHSTQLIEPEPLLRLLLELNASFGVMANLADDLRNLQRTEIGEVRESFAQGQVGSSTMPQKRNPDPAELIRGKSGRAYGDLVALLVMQKGLPLAYDRDLQEDKSLVFDSGDTASSCAAAFARLVRALEPKVERMREAAEDGCLWAADAAEFLVLRGVPFRTAYVAGRKLVEARAAAAGPAKLGRSPAVGAVIADLGAEGLAALHESWKGVDPGELSRYLSLDACIARRDLVGGPAPSRARVEIERLRAFVAEKRTSVNA